MKEIKVEKITLNIGTGKPGPELEKGMILLKAITDKKPCETKTKKRIPGWSLRPGLAIGCKVTIRGEEAKKLLVRLLAAIENRVSIHVFDKQGNFSFGVPEYLEIPDMDYIPEVGIIGLEVAVTLQRAGFRVKSRSQKRRKVPQRHRISKEESLEYAKKEFKIKIKEEEEE
ncbi:50S ribosomal protein L5 [archaeon]|nr:50S ribosomal protein L5 [archaeon]|tara:strand:+ start:317 stop:829 length:513 start_codon:yes stop_codon:yes gene_type:complete